jgi:hypothetical protein
MLAAQNFTARRSEVSDARANELSEDICRTRTILFLGAGASAALGLDLMDSFMNRLESGIRPDLLPVLQQIYSARGGKRDLEILFGRLEDYRTVEEYCQNDPNWKQAVSADKVTTLMRIVEAIRTRTESLVVSHYADVDRARVVGHYSFLFNGLVEANAPRHLPVFTTNYDTAVETLVDDGHHNYELVDGFTGGQVHRWSPDREFHRYQHSGSGTAGRTVLLFKLHGSSSWYRRRDRDIVIKAGGMATRLSQDPNFENALVWPRETKHVPEGPYEVNYRYLRECLGLAKWCMVIGFSFRDEEIRRCFERALAANPELCLVIVDPYAEGIIGEKLQLADSKRVNAVVSEFGIEQLSAIAAELTKLGFPFEDQPRGGAAATL